MDVARVATRGCGTCKDRKILCDRGVPTCQQCVRSKRTCKGYRMQLSWPKPGDGRRAIVMKQKQTRWGKTPEEPEYMPGTHLVHAYSRDVELHYYLNASLPIRPTLRIPMPYNQSPLDVKDLDLLEYFQCAASQSLTVFGHDPRHLGKTLMRVALSGGNTPTATAVLNALLALSSLHRYGVTDKAIELKIASLKALASASTDGLTIVEVMQHVVSGMLLCSFEIHQSTCTSSQWTWYINGAKEVLHATCPGAYRRDEEVIMVLNWLYYHDVMSRFTMRHWTGVAAKLPSNPTDVWPEGITQVLPSKLSMPVDDCVERTAITSLSTVQLLADVIKVSSVIPNLPTMPHQEREDLKALLRLQDWRIKSTPIEPSTEHCPEKAAVVELHRLAMRVYLNCASGHVLGQAAKTRQHLDRAFDLFAQLSACERLFPVFVLGSQARTDHERAIVLDLMARTEKKQSSRSLNHVQILVQAIWTQDDLADGELDYWTKLTAIISCCSIVPSLV